MKIKMKDLGSKPSEVTAMKAEKYYPSTTIDAEDFPGLVGHPLGKDCTVTMKLRKTGERIDTRSGGKKSHRIDLELRGMGVEKKKEHGYKNLNEASFGARKEKT